MPDRRYVLDSNVVVSALLLRKSTARQAFDLVTAHGKHITSAHLVAELHRVLSRSRFDPYVPPADRMDFLREYVRVAELVVVDRHVEVCRDPDDDAVLALAACGAAECVVSGDEDLLSLSSFEGIPIITPAIFVAHMTADAGPRPGGPRN